MNKPCSTLGLAQVSGLCQDKKLSIEELHVEEGRLDELFREITKTDSDD